MYSYSFKMVAELLQTLGLFILQCFRCFFKYLIYRKYFGQQRIPTPPPRGRHKLHKKIREENKPIWLSKCPCTFLNLLIFSLILLLATFYSCSVRMAKFSAPRAISLFSLHIFLFGKYACTIS